MTEDDAARATHRARMERAVQRWSGQLIDVSGRNQLLYYKTLKRGTLELTQAAGSQVGRLLSGADIRLRLLFSEQADHDDALRRARTIHKKSVANFEERGLATLFLVYGMATWHSESSQSTPAAPVLLRPLTLTPKGSAQADFTLALDGDWEVNDALLHVLAREYSVDLDEELLDDLVEQFARGEPDPGRVFQSLSDSAAQVDGFAIDRRIVVGTFAYAKQPMVNDLIENVDVLAEHELISAIAGDPAARAGLAERRASSVDLSLPDRIPPADEFLILDSDASQNWAMNRALAGEPLIIQGPPGTGKSQTIANLIAALTARGKRVLFVAEKRAAIDAVAKRLKQVGLDDLLMDLHGGVTSKRQLAQDLARTIEGHSRVLAPDLADLHRRLELSRSSLSEHADALHQEREPWGLSLYEVNERLIELQPHPQPAMRFSGRQLRGLPAEEAVIAEEYLREWARLAEPINSGRSPWSGSRIATESEARQALDLVDELASDAVPDARRQLDAVLQDTGLPAPDSVDSWQQTLALLRAVTTTLAVLAPDVFRMDLDRLEAELAPGGGSWWDRLIAQLFDSQYRAAKREVGEHWLDDGRPGGAALHAAVASARSDASGWRDLGGTGHPVLPRDLGAAEDSHGLMVDRLAALSAYLVTRDLAGTPARQMDDEIAALLRDERMALRLPRIHELESWLEAHHCRDLMEAVRQGRLAIEDAPRAFLVAWYNAIRIEATAFDQRLANFDPALQDTYVEQFRAADREHLQTTPARIRRRTAEQAVAVRSAHPEQDILVRREANKRSRHLPLRQLFDRAPDVLTALRPCWTMSPLAVSHILPARPVFDVVIFDEASQVLPADAIPALLRAPQAVVAGDSRQLPPTTFFAGIDDSPEDETEEDAASISGFESILDVLDALLAKNMLTWHYRSQDERLIAFSNHMIYDSALTTFPGTTVADCLTFDLVPHVPGLSVDTRSSDAEVARVVDLMLRHARERPEESLGVITMGKYHADRIEAALRARLRDERDAELDRFFDEERPERAFVKSIERVQGDERDAILLTVGYGKTADGRLPYRFGPLLQQGGERRLNVAVTRSRRRMTVVSSFSHTDMDANRSSARGVDLLRRYLKFVESGGRDLDGSEQNPPLNPFEIDIKRRLEAAGLQVEPQYGTSGYRIDFAVAHPEQPGVWVLAIEADGARYHSSPTARDRDRLRQDVLERLGWRFHRIWSTAWFADADQEMVKVQQAYERAVAEADAGVPRRKPAPAAPPPAAASDSTAEPTARPGRRPSVGGGVPITEYSTRELVELVQWVESDGRLRTDHQLLDELVDELGYRRKGSRIVARLEQVIAIAHR